MNTTKISSLVAISVFGIASAASANIITNGDFEAGTGIDADGWSELSGPVGFVGRSDSMPFSGTYAAYMSFDHINNSAAGAAYFMEQNQPVGSITAGESYDLSFQAKVDSTSFVGMDTFVQILWLDQDGSDGGGVRGELLTSLIGLGINESYQEFSLDGLVAAAGADSFLLRFQISAGAVPDIANGLYVDDISLSQVPAPASAALFGLGGLLVNRRRR
tara:strand:+ start:1623 stop:2276 length:654 start_codon:yes stop_codon:yes gene_type:complete